MLTSLDLMRITKFMMNFPQGLQVLALAEKLDSFKVVESTQTPEDLVTMNSVVLLQNITMNETMEIKLVYQHAPFNGNQVSVLSPLGAALLGMKTFETSKFELRDGTINEIRVLDILYQPEKNGQLDL